MTIFYDQRLCHVRFKSDSEHCSMFGLSILNAFYLFCRFATKTLTINRFKNPLFCCCCCCRWWCWSNDCHLFDKPLNVSPSFEYTNKKKTTIMYAVLVVSSHNMSVRRQVYTFRRPRLTDRPSIHSYVRPSAFVQLYAAVARLLWRTCTFQLRSQF